MVWLPKLTLLFLTYCHISSSSSSSQNLCRPETRTALISLNYPTWLFNMSDDCCTWPWVECDTKTGHVTSLQSFSIFLNGTITSKSPLFSFRHLQELRIFGLETNIGADAFDALTQNLTSLVVLDLMRVDMSSVPPASLMNLSSSLISLTIVSCGLTGTLPTNFFHFPKLKFLDLSSNNLGGQLQSICSNCTLPSNLTNIYLQYNSFSGPIPSWIYTLPNLEWLYLENNLLTGEIREFKSSSLITLKLNNNTLHGAIPISLLQLKDLAYLDLSSNNFTGMVEFQELSKLKELYYLDLSQNNFSIIYNCTKCTFENMRVFQLSSCNLSAFPHFLRSSKNLAILDLSKNQIHGNVPKWLRELDRLVSLDLRSNLFFGPLPEFSPMLALFLASKNQFSGEIPSSICNPTSLSILDLSYNNLSGRIPPCIDNFKSLWVLDLRSNKLHGEIPESLFFKESQLHNLNLNGNQLEGQLPRSLANCTNLEVINIGNNRLNDTFPDWLESFPNLQVLVLRGNKFHGSIENPNPGFPFQTLRIMDLSHNDFTGALPEKYFVNFRAMQMDTERVKLEYMGEESYYQDSVTLTIKGFDFELMRILNIFTAIDFSSNNFTGEIPEFLGKLKSLHGLNLSHNALTGILPPSLGNLTNIEWLDLSSNKLVGKIPEELANIPWLSNLNLSYNHLEGPIPRGKQFNTFRNESFEGNLNLCGFPLSKLCGGDPKPPEPSIEQDEDSSNITNGFNWRIVTMGYASGLVIGISIGYILLCSNGKLHWLSERILEEMEYRRAIKPKKRNARR